MRLQKVKMRKSARRLRQTLAANFAQSFDDNHDGVTTQAVACQRLRQSIAWSAGAVL
jgi:hypothetical protein